MNFSENTTPLRERVERHETFTIEDYSDAVDKFSDNLRKLYDLVSKAMAPEGITLLERIARESDDLTAISCMIEDDNLREASIRKYDEAIKNNPDNKGLFTDYNDQMELACGLTALLRKKVN